MDVEGESTEHGARRQIAELLQRYATAIDSKDWPLLRSCFSDDAKTDYGDIGQWSHADAITEFMAEVHAGMRDTKHMLHNIAITVQAPDRATAVTYVHAVLVPAQEPNEWIDAVGQYDDEIVRTEGGWRIASRVFTMTRTFSSKDLRPESRN